MGNPELLQIPVSRMLDGQDQAAYELEERFKARMEELRREGWHPREGWQHDESNRGRS